MRKKVVTIIVAALLAMTMLAGCGSSNSNESKGAGEDSATAQANEKTTLTMAFASDPGSFDVSGTDVLALQEMSRAWGETLFYTDAENNIQPCLVDTYEMTDENTWTFKLKEGVKFQDGTELDAEDVKATFERLADTSSAKYVANIDDIEIVDTLTFKITTKQSAPLEYVNYYYGNTLIYPSEKIAENWDFAKEPVSTGPYKFSSYTAGEEVVLERFDDYRQGTPAFEKIVIKFIPEAASRTIALEAGEVDYVNDVNIADLSTIEADSSLDLTFVSAGDDQLFVNNSIWPLNNVNVRKAIQSAVDRDAIIAGALEGLGTPSYSLLPSYYAGATDENTVGFDVEQAKKYLSESGEDLSNWTFTIYCKDDTLGLIGQVMQQNLNAIGINTEVQVMDNATIMGYIKDKTYTSYIVQGYTAPTAYDYIKNLYGSQAIGSTNLGIVDSPEIDAFLEKAAKATSDDERNAIIEECVKFMNENCFNIALCTNETVIKAYNSHLKGVEINPNKWMTSFFNLKWE